VYGCAASSRDGANGRGAPHPGERQPYWVHGHREAPWQVDLPYRAFPSPVRSATAPHLFPAGGGKVPIAVADGATWRPRQALVSEPASNGVTGVPRTSAPSSDASAMDPGAATGTGSDVYGQRRRDGKATWAASRELPGQPAGVATVSLGRWSCVAAQEASNFSASAVGVPGGAE
jgi:hypothetical protein